MFEQKNRLEHELPTFRLQTQQQKHKKLLTVLTLTSPSLSPDIAILLSGFFQLMQAC